jgi:hypothetical protein
MNFNGIPVHMCPGLNDFDCVLGLKSDLHFGTGLLSDTNETKLIDMSDIDGSQNDSRYTYRFESESEIHRGNRRAHFLASLNV